MAARTTTQRGAQAGLVKVSSATKDKALSSVTLTKKTQSLISDVDELKINLREIKDQERELLAADHKNSSQLIDLTEKVSILQDAFNSLSDVFTLEVDELRSQMQEQLSCFESRFKQLNDTVSQLQSQVSRINGRQKQYQEQTVKSTSAAQESISKVAMSLYETQADLTRVTNHTDQLMSREQETTRMLHGLQTSHEQAHDYIQRIRQEFSSLQTELCVSKEESTSNSLSLAADLEALSKETASLRTGFVKEGAKLTTRLEALRESIERQNRMEKTQLQQRIDALGDALVTHEVRSKEATNGLLKNHTRIRFAVDGSMKICSSEMKNIGYECKKSQEDHQSKLDELSELLLTHQIECSKQWEEIQTQLRRAKCLCQ